MSTTIRQELRSLLQDSPPETRIRHLFAFLKDRGQSNYDESVTQLEHALQCAELARSRGLPDRAIAAALLHDIGHLLVDEHDGQNAFLEQDLNHEAVGAEFLDEWFPREVTDPIQLHVAAKRYLCTTDSTYYDQLSEASKRSFALQGGPLSDEEREQLEGNPHLEIALTLRRLDDQGKVAGKPCPAIEDFAGEVGRSLR